MNKDIYTPELRSLLQGHFADNYIGQGNPAAKILIIAKEDTITGDQKTYAIDNNFRQWQDNYNRQFTQEQVAEWFTCRKDSEKYNALFPYKGIRFVHERNGNQGSSATYYAYQKFINLLLPDNLRTGHRGEINFFNYCFITELSLKTKPMSGRYDEETARSIQARFNAPDAILRQPFFQQFPVVILACFRYFDMYGMNIQDTFNTRFDAPTKDIGRHEFINRHISADGKRLLLHTNHFARRSNNFIAAVAGECSDFISRQSINIIN